MTYKVIIVVPWWKKQKMLDKGEGSAAVIAPFEHVPCVRADAIIMDSELKHLWDEHMDEWFHGCLLHRMGPWGTYVAWGTETDPKEMKPDAKA